MINSKIIYSILACTLTYLDNCIGQLPDWTTSGDTNQLSCYQTGQCSSYNITCPDDNGYDCYVDCSIQSCCTDSQFNYFNNHNSFDMNVVCNGPKSCENSTIHCPNDAQTCAIDCNGGYACLNTKINHLKSIEQDLLNVENLQINCASQSSCANSEIYCNPYGTCSITCNTNSCVGAQINLGFDSINFNAPSSSSTIKLELFCTTTGSCENANVTCIENGECELDCTGGSSCDGSIFKCPTDGDCDIDCSGSASCKNSVVYCPSNSGNCTIDCEHQQGNCQGMTVYCYESHELFSGSYDANFCNIFQCPDATTDFDCTATWIPDGTGSPIDTTIAATTTQLTTTTAMIKTTYTITSTIMTSTTTTNIVTTNTMSSTGLDTTSNTINMPTSYANTPPIITNYSHDILSTRSETTRSTRITSSLHLRTSSLSDESTDSNSGDATLMTSM